MGYIRTSDHWLGMKDENTSEIKIANAKKYFMIEDEEVKRHGYLRKIAEINLINTIKNEVSYGVLSYIDMNKAQKWMSMRDSKGIDKRRNYAERDSFNQLNNLLSKDYFTDEKGKFEITSIYKVGGKTPKL